MLNKEKIINKKEKKFENCKILFKDPLDLESNFNVMMSDCEIVLTILFTTRDKNSTILFDKKMKNIENFQALTSNEVCLQLEKNSAICFCTNFLWNYYLFIVNNKYYSVEKYKAYFYCSQEGNITFISMKNNMQIDFRIESLDDKKISIYLKGVQSKYLEDKDYIILKFREFCDQFFYYYKIIKNQFEIYDDE